METKGEGVVGDGGSGGGGGDRGGGVEETALFGLLAYPLVVVGRDMRGRGRGRGTGRGRAAVTGGRRGNRRRGAGRAGGANRQTPEDLYKWLVVDEGRCGNFQSYK